jgi:ribosomal protein L11 methyltransferase
VGKKRYYEIKIGLHKDVSEAVCSFLMENGALGAVEENVFVDRKRAGERVWIRAYFNGEKEFLRVRGGLKRFLNELKRNFPDFNEYRVLGKWLEEKNWRESYKKHFKPIRVSKRIVVRPGYENYTKKKGENVIVIDPKMAFGIGNHPTTKMCVKYVDELISSRRDVSGLKLLDAGTGTGIIAIAAAMLGVKDVYGFDIDETAYEIARENVKMNGVDGIVKLGCHGFEGVSGEYDIVFANILSHILIKKKGVILRSVKKGGGLVLSGILTSQMDEVKRVFLSGTGLKLHSVKKEKEWVALYFRA